MTDFKAPYKRKMTPMRGMAAVAESTLPEHTPGTESDRVSVPQDMPHSEDADRQRKRDTDPPTTSDLIQSLQEHTAGLRAHDDALLAHSKTLDDHRQALRAHSEMLNELFSIARHESAAHDKAGKELKDIGKHMTAASVALDMGEPVPPEPPPGIGKAPDGTDYGKAPSGTGR